MAQSLANVEFDEFNWGVLIIRAFVATNTNLNIVSRGLGQLCAEPGRTVEGTFTSISCSTV